MRILIACDSFKGSLGSAEAAKHISIGIRRVDPDAHIDVIPIADGGEGTALALAEALGGKLERVQVRGPMGDPVEAVYGILPGGEAVMDMASASGLTLVPTGKTDVLSASTYGTGQLILAALDKGCRRIYLGIGGSATNDGGLGMAQALGARFPGAEPQAERAAPQPQPGAAALALVRPQHGARFPGAEPQAEQAAPQPQPGAAASALVRPQPDDRSLGSVSAEASRPLAVSSAPQADAGRPSAAPLLAGKHLAGLAAIDLSGIDPRLADTEISVLCDVTNPLCGPGGASYIYGPQKGADPAEMAQLDAGLDRLAGLVKRDLGLDLAEAPGAGAAGGLGFGLMAFAGARLLRGVDFMLDAAGFDEKARLADLVITGEGRLDHQSAFGKTPAGVARRGAALGKPVAAVGGAIAGGAQTMAALREAGVGAIEACVCAPMPLEEAMEKAPALLADASERLMHSVALGTRLVPCNA
ncbi:MAG: glycerate kinase [Clostridiales bacterium]|nr:glycerate kinase [Clostridiales bacterium]